MLKKAIRNLQKKPKHVRDGIAFTIASAVTLIIFTVWLYNAPTRNDAIEMRYSESKEGDSGFSSIFGGFKEQVANLKDSSQVEDGEVASTTTGNSQNKQPPTEPLFGNQTSTNNATSSDNNANNFKSSTTINIITTKATSATTSTSQGR